MKYKYNQELPTEVEKDLDSYIDRVKNIKWFKPTPTLQRTTVDAAVQATISAFGVSTSIEYRKLSTPSDLPAVWGASLDAVWGASWDAAWDTAWDAARYAARDAVWDAAWDAVWPTAWPTAWPAARAAARDAAWGAQDLLATHTKTYTLKAPFLKLMDIWEMGLYPCGVIDGKFVVYVPEEVWSNFETPTQQLEVIINGVKYVPAN